MFENGPSPKRVAYLKKSNLLTLDKEPEIRHVVGSDANSLLEKRKEMPYSSCHTKRDV